MDMSQLQQKDYQLSWNFILELEANIKHLNLKNILSLDQEELLQKGI